MAVRKESGDSPRAGADRVLGDLAIDDSCLQQAVNAGRALAMAAMGEAESATPEMVEAGAAGGLAASACLDHDAKITRSR